MRYKDYALIDGITRKNARKGFANFADYHLAEASLENSPYKIDALMRIDEEISDESGEKIHNILTLEENLLAVLADMEMTGVAFDKAKLRDIGERMYRDLERIEREIYLTAGEAFNINSPKQIQVLLFEKLKIKPLKKNKTGYSVDTEVLEEIAKEHPIAAMILEYRLLAKLDSTYVQGLMKSINPLTGRIHTTYDSLGAATGRMSSNDPNLQNIPVGDGYAREIKSCFIPSTGNILLVADYSQIELRVLAFLSQDEAFLSAFRGGEDIHTRTAKFLFPHEVTISATQRRIAKTVNFGVIYGITGFGLAKTLDCTPWEAKEYIDAFYARYPGVRNYYDTLLENARKDGYVETYFGRRRYIGGINDANKTIRSLAEREAMNMPVQGTAADMLKYAMVRIHAEIRARGLTGKMILQVHDELVFDIPPHEESAFTTLVRDCMENVLPEANLPIVADIHSGKNWAEAK